jgi:glutaredoxin
MKLHFILTGLLATLACNTLAGEVYRWVDNSGKVHYGDTRAPEAADAKKKKLSSSPATGDEVLSFETRRVKQNFPVTLYVADGCAELCKQARNLLNQRGVPFTEKNLTTPEEISTFKRASGAETVPVLSVGKNWLKNYQAEQWHGELDAAGYPKTAPYRPQAPAKPVAEKPAAQR